MALVYQARQIARMTSEETIGDRIVAAYTAAGLNRNQFTKALGTTYSNVMRWEKNETKPGTEYAQKIAEICGRSVGWLLGREDEAPTTSEPFHGDAPVPNMEQLGISALVLEGLLEARSDEERELRKLYQDEQHLGGEGDAVEVITWFRRTLRNLRNAAKGVDKRVAEGEPVKTTVREGAMRRTPKRPRK